MKLVINLPNDRIEPVAISCINKLYDLTRAGTLDGTSSLVGYINASSAYLDYIDYLRTAWPDLIITATNIYIRFEDNAVKQVLLNNNIGDGEGITVQDASTANIGNIFLNNTQITSFNEFSFFTRANNSETITFSGSSLESIDLTNIRCSTLDLNNCSSLINFMLEKEQGFLEIPSTVTRLKLRNTNVHTLKINNSIGTGWKDMDGVPLNKVYVNGGFDIWNNCNFDDTNGTPIQDNTELFFDNIKVENLVIPSGTTQIAKNIFKGYKLLLSITIPQSLTTIGRDAFLNATNTEKIYITDINNYCRISTNHKLCLGNTEILLNNSPITSVIIPSDVKILYPVFGNCKTLTSVTLNLGLELIESRCFDNCSNLGNVTIPNSVTTINDYAFNKCISFTRIEIPQSVTLIGSSAFAWCSNVSEIVLNEGLQFIGANAFAYYNRSIGNVVLPSTLTSIRWGAFSNTTISNLTCKAVTPPALQNADFDMSGNIYVPSLSVLTYKTAENWSSYASRIQAIPNT